MGLGLEWAGPVNFSHDFFPSKLYTPPRHPCASPHPLSTLPRLAGSSLHWPCSPTMQWHAVAAIAALASSHCAYPDRPVAVDSYRRRTVSP